MNELITSLLEKGVLNKDFPGASYAVVYKDGTVVSDFVGNKQVIPKIIKNIENNIYDCASLTKVISTTTMIMKLIEDSKLSLDTFVQEIISEFKYSNITIYHLLTHTSGLPADITNAKDLRNRLDVEEKVFEAELINEVGGKIVYSDIGYILLGFIIEVISDKPLDIFSKEVIFDNLNMEDTGYSPDISRCAPTEVRNDDVYKGLLVGKVHDEKSFALGGLSGHAGLFSTTKDIALFILSILNNDEKILKKETVDELFKLQVRNVNKNNKELVRALGWDKPTIGGTAGDKVSFDNTIVHTGFTGCNMWIERELGIGFVLLSNAVHPKRENNGIIKYRNKIGNVITDK